jgi:flagellin
MIGKSVPIANALSSVYSANSKLLSAALTRIASGKKFQNASDDLAGFIRSQNIRMDIGGYERVRENLTAFKTYTAAAVGASSDIYESLLKMRKLTEQYAGTTDADEQAQYEAEFDSLKTQVASMLANTTVDGTNVTATGSITTVSLDPDGYGTLDMNFSDSAEMGAGLTIDAVGATALVQTEIDSMLTYLSEAKAYDCIADRQLDLTTTIINGKKAVLSLITDIDEAKEINRVLDLTLRQEATVAMMAQANMVRNSIVKLYE